MTTWVLLRGLAREQLHWGEFASLLRARLPAGDRVVAPDLPGNGARWPETSPVRVPALVDAIRAELHAQAATGPLMLVALSLGGMVALQWAEQAPLEVRGCVLINTSLGGVSPFWQRLQPRALPGLLRALIARTTRARELAILRATSNRPPDPAVLEQWVAIAGQHPVHAGNVARQLLAAARFRARARPRVPVLVLASQADRLVSPQCSATLARAWQLPLHLHPDAGHDLPLDDPQWLVERIVQWSTSA